MTALTPTYRPMSVRNRCVIEVFGGVFYVVMLLFGFFCGCRGFCHRTESDLFPFLSWIKQNFIRLYVQVIEILLSYIFRHLQRASEAHLQRQFESTVHPTICSFPHSSFQEFDKLSVFNTWSSLRERNFPHSLLEVYTTFVRRWQ